MLKPEASIDGRKTGRRGQLRRLLRAANSNIRQRAGLEAAGPRSDAGDTRPGAVTPGPFDAPVFREGEDRDPVHALITGLLVVYPVFASVAVVLAGLWLLGSSRPV
jgi:hypothetical protein